MARRQRPFVGIGLVAAAVVAGFLATGRAPWPTGRQEAAARAARGDLETRLQAERAALASRARRAAGLGRLKAALAAHVDTATLVDLFATEDWWRPFRNEFQVSRVVSDGQTASHGSLDTEGAERPLVAAARREGYGAALLVIKSQPYLVAAARVEMADRTPLPVVVLVKSCDSSWLADLAAQAQVGLMLTDDQAPILVAGEPALRRFLLGISSRTSGPIAADRAGQWGAAQFELGSGLRLWALRAVPGEAGVRGTPLWLWFLLAATLAVYGAYLLRKPSVRAPSRPPSGTVGEGAEKSRLPSPSPAGPPEALGSLEGKTVGRYRLVKKIADGGMSEIYRAVAFGAEGFSRTFVVKRLKPELARVKEAVAQFVDEARLQASLVHSNVVPVLDFGTQDNEYFMTEEYVVGRDVLQLSERCVAVTGSPMDPRIGYHIGYEALQALHYAHTRADALGQALEIVHRDVSAINVMVTESGDVKLFDFGIAKANLHVTRTHMSMIRGNPHFMSPEHARGQPVDARSDVFSMGLLLYFCMTNRMLYTGSNALDVLYRAACGPTDHDLYAINSLPSPAPALLRGALEVNPELRFETAADLAAALNPFAAGGKYKAAELINDLFGDELRSEMSSWGVRASSPAPRTVEWRP
jgi:Protein kinase domain